MDNTISESSEEGMEEGVIWPDVNIITQTPKISKYKNKIVKSISNICGISENKISIKGKTTEKLGLIGKEKAIACEVIASISKYVL